METQNIRDGQIFAQPSMVPIRSETSIDKESSSIESRGTSNQSDKSFATLGVSDRLVSESNKELPKAISFQADSVNSEENDKQLDEAISKVESFLKVQNRDLAFSIDEETNRSIVTVKDSQSGDVIRQIPSEEVLKLAERIQELQQDVGNSVGVFINNQV